MKNIISLPASEWKSALTGLGKVIPKRASLPALTAIQVERDCSGSVHLRATDLDTFVAVQVGAPQVGAPSQFLVPFEPLQKAVKGLGANEEVSLIYEGEDAVTIETQVAGQQVRQAHEVPYMDDWPEMPEFTNEAILTNDRFNTALKQALEFGSRDESRAILNSACIDATEKNAHYIVGASGRAIFSANSFHFDGMSEPVIVPYHKFLTWKGFDGESGSIAVQPAKEVNEQTWIRLSSDKWTFIGKQPEGQYPNWKQVYPRDSAKAVITFTEVGLKAVLDLLPKLPETDSHNDPIIVQVSRGQVFLQSDEVACPIVEAQVTGDDCVVALRREFIAKALRMGLDKLAIVDELTPVVFSNDGRRVAVAPVRMTDAVPPPNKPEAAPKEETPATALTSDATAMVDPPEPSVQLVMQHIDGIKDNLKQVVRDLTETLKMLKHVEREKKANDKEIAQIKAKLREIQSVEI